MRTIIEQGVAFAYLDLNDLESLEALALSESQSALRSQIESMPDLTPQQKMQLWVQYAQTRISVEELQYWCAHTRRGIDATLKAALEKAGTKAASLTYDIVSAGNLAAHLLGLENRIPFEEVRVLAKQPPTPPETTTTPAA